jgi:hypothetical protein
MKTRIQALERSIQRTKRALADLGRMRPGSLSVQRRKWGGQYGQLSYTHRGQGHTEYIPQQQRQAVERQLANYKRFRELTREWIDLEIALCKLELTQGAEAK